MARHRTRHRTDFVRDIRSPPSVCSYLFEFGFNCPFLLVSFAGKVYIYPEPSSGLGISDAKVTSVSVSGWTRVTGRVSELSLVLT